MEELIAQLEQIKLTLRDQAINALQADSDLPVHVLIALPKVRTVLSTLKQANAQIQAQQAQGGN